MWLLQALEAYPPPKREELLPLALSEDARFLIVDMLPEADPVRQAEVCATTGRFVCDCTWHGMERWARRGPDEASIRAVAAGSVTCAEQHASGVGRAVGCTGLGTCDGLTNVEDCRREVERARQSRELCVPRETRPVPG